MSRYTKTDVVTGDTVKSDVNVQLGLIETAVADTLSRKGDSPNAMEADLDMDSNQILNLPNATTRQEPATYGQVLDQVDWSVAVGEAKYYDTVAAATSDTSLVVGDVVIIKERASGVFDVISGTGTANTYNIIAHDSLSLSLELEVDGTANVRAFGATGDGVTNDTVAFTNAASAAPVVLVPEATSSYVVSGASIGTTTFIFYGDLSTELTGTDTADDLNAVGYSGGALLGLAQAPELRDKGIEIIAGTIRQQQYRAVTSITRSSTVGTVTMPSHGYSVGDYVSITGSLTTGYNGSFLIDTVPDVDTFTIPIESDLAAQQESGTTDSTTTNKLVDSTQNFSSTVIVGTMVVNTTNNTVSHVAIVDSNTSLTLRDDIMVSGDTYTIGQPAHPTTALKTGDAGTTDGTTASKLVDSSQNFLTTVTAGMFITNTTDDTYTKVTAVDSDTVLSVEDDIFVSGEGYIITSLGLLSAGRWEHINDSSHAPLGVNTAVDVNPSGSGIGLTMSFNKTFSKVLTFTCGPDEQASAASSLTIGASVSLSAVEIRGSVNKTVAGRLQYDGTSGWLTSMGNDQGRIYVDDAPSPVENVYYSAGNLYVSHGFCPGQNANVTWNTLNGTSFTYQPVIKTVTDDYTIVNFIHINAGAYALYTGVAQAGMCLQFTKNYSGTMYFDGRDRSGEIGMQFGNIWYFGIMQV